MHEPSMPMPKCRNVGVQMLTKFILPQHVSNYVLHDWTFVCVGQQEKEFIPPTLKTLLLHYYFLGFKDLPEAVFQ